MHTSIGTDTSAAMSHSCELHWQRTVRQRTRTAGFQQQRPLMAKSASSRHIPAPPRSRPTPKAHSCEHSVVVAHHIALHHACNASPRLMEPWGEHARPAGRSGTGNAPRPSATDHILSPAPSDTSPLPQSGGGAKRYQASARPYEIQNCSSCHRLRTQRLHIS